jgi:hypothetical protein
MMTYRSARAEFLLLLLVLLVAIGFFAWRKHLQPTRFPPSSPGRVGPVALYPDSDWISGATDPRVSQSNIAETICSVGWTKSVRPPVRVTNGLKFEMMRERGIEDPSAYELDHLIPLELGGCPDCKENLWLERYFPEPGAREKDRVENFLHRQVCTNKISLEDAQRAVAGDWYKVYLEILAHSHN